MDGTAIGLMLLLCTIWSLQQVSLKAITPDVMPMMMIASRSGIAAALLGLVMVARRERLRSSCWRPGLLIGVLFALQYLFIAQGLRHTHASHIIVFHYLAPIFAALVLHWRIPAERLGAIQWVGIIAAFVGIVVAFMGRGTAQSLGIANATLWGNLMGLLAAAAWGITTVLVRCSSLSNAPPTEILLYQLLGAFVVLMAVAFGAGQTAIQATAAFWGHLLFQAIFVSFVSFLAWFWLLRHYLASRLGALSFITPIFGVCFGACLLGESFDTGFIAGGLLVLVGTVVVNSSILLEQLWRLCAALFGARQSIDRRS